MHGVIVHRARSARAAGFTIVEVMVAMVVMLVGVLGTVALIDSAAKVGSSSRSREAATNLTREIIEAAREVDYDVLLTGTAPAALQAINGLDDTDASTAGWQIRRRNVTFTVTAASCIYDDPRDGLFGGSLGAGYCSAGSPTTPADSNGDDYRKVTITAQWASRKVTLVADVVNPAGGFGPRIKTVTSTPAINSSSIIPVSGGTNNVAVTVGTTTAKSLNWDAGDAQNGGQLTDASGATSWSFTWNLGTPATAASYSCGTTVDWVPDSPAYQMTFQPFDSSGTPGDLRTQTVSIDRSTPYPLCDFTGGRNPEHGSVVDLQWGKSFEGDVVSYSVWRQKQGTETSDPLICDAVRASECSDTNPPAAGGAIDYYVKPKQDNFALGTIFGPQTNLNIPAAGTPNSPPSAPGSPTATGGSQPTITWTASSDGDGSVIFYRVYRDGTAIADRYGKTTNGATLSFTDKSAGGTSHTYYVSAVDDAFAESTLVQAQ
jgi:hypothetical protein